MGIIKTRPIALDNILLPPGIPDKTSLIPPYLPLRGKVLVAGGGVGTTS